MNIIEVSHLVKEYKKIKKESGLRGAVKNFFVQKAEYIRAVDDISFSIEKGDIVGYIGPNGAGKSATVKMLCGIMRPTSGEILIDGISPQRDRKRVVRNLGVVFGQRSQLNWDLRLGETFELLKRIYQIDDRTYADNLGMLNEIFQIDRFIDTPVRQLSLGQRMRGDLMAAMLHSPEVLFLDEPTIGLDVEAKYAVRKFIKEINQRGKTTIILTTHDLGDIQELCQRVIIINEGKIIEDGSLDELIDKIAPYRHLIIDFYHPATVSHPHAELISVNEARSVYRFRKDEITAARLIAITTITINVQKQSWCFCVFKDQHSANSCHIRRRKAIQEREKCYTILNSGLAIVKLPTKAQSAFIYNIDSSTTEKVVSYYAIDVTNGDKLTGLVEDLDEVAAPTYPLYLNDESAPLVPRITQDNAAVTEYNVAVTVSGNGKAYGNGTYVNGTFAKVEAATDGDEKFQGWYLDDSLVSTEGEYRFLVDKDISLVAKFGESPSADTYALTVVDGTGSGSYESGAQISITANSVPDGKVFDKWTTNNGGTFVDASSASTTFAMPANNVTITATYKDIVTPPTPGGHTHSWATAWSSNGTHHWYECTASDCDIADNRDKNSYGVHVYDDDADSICNTCGYTRAVTPPTPPRPTDKNETYYISISKTDNGEVIPSTRHAEDGERVTLTAHPNAGYELDSITVTNVRGREITLRDLGSSRYSFTMPNTRVSVSASFTKIVDGTPSTPADDEPFTGLGTPGISGIVLNPAAMPFTDVKSSYWFYNNVDYVWKRYLMSGVSDTQFAPNTTTSRAMIWTVLARMNNVRTDINPGSTWYEKGMLWAMEQGVTDGSNPMDDITREQLATMLWRSAGSPGGRADLNQFSDSSSVSGYAVSAIRWAVANGILQGSDGKLNPKGTATRAQVAAMVQRYGERIGA